MGCTSSTPAAAEPAADVKPITKTEAPKEAAPPTDAIKAAVPTETVKETAPTTPVAVHGNSTSDFGANTPFVLTARVKVNEGNLEEYLGHVRTQVKACLDSEPGCHHYTFSQDPEDPLWFRWADVYKNDAEFFAHITNPSLGVYLGKHGELGENFEIEIFGSVGEELAAKLKELPFPVTVYPTETGFSRSGSAVYPVPSGLTVHGDATTDFSADTPFVLTAKVSVKEGNRDEYLEHVRTQVKACMDSEPGCQHYTFNADSENPLWFRWSDVYKNDKEFFAHITNPSLGVYLGKHGELGEVFEIEIFGTVGEELGAKLKELPFPVKVYTTETGFSRA